MDDTLAESAEVGSIVALIIVTGRTPVEPIETTSLRRHEFSTVKTLVL
jgi:hypothetical protein